MIPVEIYKPVYFVLLTVLLVAIFLPSYLNKSIDAVKSTSHKFVLIALLVLTIAFIGFRDPNGSGKYLGDTKSYTRTFEAVKYGYQTEFSRDYGFYYFMKLFSGSLDVVSFYVVCAFIYVLLPYFTFKKWLGGLSLYLLIAYVTAFSFLPFGINGLRNGLASAIFIFGLGFYNKKWLMFFILILSTTFHKGMLLPFFALTLSYIIKNPKHVLYIWLLSIPLSLGLSKNFEEITLALFESQSIVKDDRALTYFSEESEIVKVSGVFRVDFILYSSVAVLIGYSAIVKKGLENVLYKKIWIMYTISNAIWILLIYAPYTNRIAYLSWFIMPVILVIPFINYFNLNIKKIKLKLFYIMFGTLAFTLIMELI